MSLAPEPLVLSATIVLPRMAVPAVTFRPPPTPAPATLLTAIVSLTKVSVPAL